MIAPAPTREVLKKLKKAGFTAKRTKGSHTFWTCPSGSHAVDVPDGHRTISPGVHRQIVQAIDACTCGQ